MSSSSPTLSPSIKKRMVRRKSITTRLGMSRGASLATSISPGSGSGSGSSMTSQSKSTNELPASSIYSPNERVLCYHLNLIYEAKVLKAENFTDSNSPTGIPGPHFFVHYKGWKQTWDEWVPPSRLLKYNDENVLLQKQVNGVSQPQIKDAVSSASVSISKGVTGSKVGGSASIAGRVGGGVGKGLRGTKRGREDDDGPRKIEMKLDVPPLLKAQLVDDWEYVTKDNQLVSLPRKPTVSELLDEFQTWALAQTTQLPKAQSLLPSITAGLRMYFDQAIGSILLYRFERVQYSEARKKYFSGPNVKIPEQKRMSEIYGAEHLLRMLVHLPSMVVQSKMDADSVNILTDFVRWLFTYMVQERSRIFMKEYETASSHYISQSRS